MSHPINELMVTAMQNIKEMVDVTTIVGDPVNTQDGYVIVPISKVAFGFAAGGGEFDFADEEGKSNSKNNEENIQMPFAGGSGAGISINPVAFLVAGQGQIRLMSIDNHSSVDRIIEMTPDIISKIHTLITRKIETDQSNNR